MDAGKYDSEYVEAKGRWLGLAAVLFGGLSAAEPIRLQRTDGSEVAPLDIGADKAHVLIFFLHDCPICNSYAPELERLNSAFAPRGVNFFIIQTDPQLSKEAAAKHAREYALTMPVLLDSANKLAQRTGARTTPEAVVIGADEKVLYRGRIDDLYADFGKRRTEPTTRDLRDALDALLAGKEIPAAGGPAVGCAIPGVK